MKSNVINEREIVMILCGEYGDQYSPLTRAAFWKLFHKYGDSVSEMLDADETIVKELFDRSASITFALDEMHQMGIDIVTFLDDDFPSELRGKLGDFCPPLFYVCGNRIINQKRMVGYVGSRTIDSKDATWTTDRVAKNLSDGFGIVTGGAQGIDSIAYQYALTHDGYAVFYLPDNIRTKIKEPFIQKYLLAERLLIYSHISPLAKKTRNSFVSAAMERNKFIYAHSVGTVVVRSDYNKGGTWSGAQESLKHKWSCVYVWNHEEYPGNRELIRLGATALSDEGNVIKSTEKSENKDSYFEGEQLSFMDLISSTD